MDYIACRVRAQDTSRPPAGAPAYVRHLYARAAVIRALRWTADRIPDDAEMERRERMLSHARAQHAAGEATAGVLAHWELLATADAPSPLCYRGVPRRHAGEPWVWRGSLLLALPLWPSRMVTEALCRLVAEGLAECAWGAPPQSATAVRLTHRGADPFALLSRVASDPQAEALFSAALAEPCAQEAP